MNPPPQTLPPKAYSVLKPPASVLSFSPTTPEYLAEQHLLSNSPRNNVVSLYGPTGAGKTTIQHTLPTLPRIRARFPDAIWTFHMGASADPQYIGKELVRFASRLCSQQFVDMFRDMLADDLAHPSAVADLVRALAASKVLLVFDDVHAVDDDALRIFRTLLGEIRGLPAAEIKMLFSTQCERLASEATPVHVVPLAIQGDIAVKMFTWYAGVDAHVRKSMCAQDRCAFDDILGLCAGLPLALAIAGKALKCRINRRKRRISSVWQCYAEELQDNMQRLGEECQPHPGLSTSLHSHLAGLADNWNNHNISAPDVFRSLCVVRKRTAIPVDTLRRIWGVCEEEGKAIVAMLEDNCLVTTDREVGGAGGKWYGLRVHDLVHDVSVRLARKETQIFTWHDRMLESYGEEFRNKQDYDIQQTRWDNEIADCYVEENVVWHLVCTDRTDEAMQLVTDYRWIEKINKDESQVPFKLVICNLKTLSDHIAKHNDATLRTVASEVEAIAETMQLCVKPCEKNRSECTFQLYGRLASLQLDSQVVKRLMWSIEKYSSLPWVRAAAGMLPSANSNLKSVVPTSFPLTCVDVVASGEELAVGGSDGKLQMIGVRNGLGALDLQGHDTDIVQICHDAESQRLYSCSSNGTVIVWKCNEQVRKIEITCLENEDSVTCMQLLSGERVAVGTVHGKLNVVNTTTGDAVKTVQGHEQRVTSLSTRCNGKIMTSSSTDKKVRMWDNETIDNICDLDHEDEVLCADLSPDEQLVACGSADKSVRIWNVEQRREICRPLVSHKGSVNCVAFDSTSKVLYTGGGDRICMWKIKNDGQSISRTHSFLDGRMSSINSLRPCAPRPELIALANGSIFIWKTNTRNRRTAANQLITDAAIFALSANERSLATYHRNKRIEVRRVSDVINGKDDATSCTVNPICLHRSVRKLAVSNNGQFVAFGGYFDANVYIIDMHLGSVIHKLHGPRRQMHWTPRDGDTQREYDSGDEALCVNTRGILTSKVRTQHGAAEDAGAMWRMGTQARSWRVATGEQVPTPRATNAMCTVANGRVSGAEKRGRTHLCVECEEHETYFRGAQVRTRGRSGLGRTQTIATMAIEPEKVLFSHATGRLWMLLHNGAVQFVDLTCAAEKSGADEPRLPFCADDGVGDVRSRSDSGSWDVE